MFSSANVVTLYAAVCREKPAMARRSATWNRADGFQPDATQAGLVAI